MRVAKWRWRRCPACKVVLAAGDFIWLGGAGWTDGKAMRQCPTCEYEGETSEFIDVRERHVMAGWVPLSAPNTAPDDPQGRLL